MGKHSRNWKGGRVVEPRGYVLIYVGKEHPLADCRGYAYEHRLKAQEKLGRPLKPKEQIHHDNEEPGDNSDNNLVPCASLKEHRFLHRKAGSNLRLPAESNPSVCCACGCGATFNKFDESGRPRLYISGHNDQPSPTRDSIRSELAYGPATIKGLMVATNRTEQALKVACSKMVQAGLIIRVRRGLYGRKD